jgi:hypothetical protein
MRRYKYQEGAGKFGLFIFTIIIIIIAYAAIKYIPIKLNSYEMQDYMEKLARNAAYKDDEIKRLLIAKAKELNIPLSDSQIRITSSPERCDIEVNYQVTLETPFMQKTFPFNLKVSEKRIY